MRLADEIKLALMDFVKGGYDVIVPNFFYGHNECDLFRINQNDYCFEYEVKISRSDFFADFKKETRNGKKHDLLNGGEGSYCPNRFFYVVPADLIKSAEVPKYAGLIYYRNGWFDLIKNASLLHRRPIQFNVYREICRTLAFRDREYRRRIRNIKRGNVETELNHAKKEIERLSQQNREYYQELFMTRFKLKKEQEDKRSVATEDAQGNDAGNKTQITPNTDANK